MTDTTTSTDGLSGVDLARVALVNARAAAKAAPVHKRRTVTSTRRARGSGRDPLPFAAAITQMMADRGWDMATRGGSIIDQWLTIAPELAGKVAAEHFDADTGTLHLRPSSDAYRAQLNLYQRQITAKVNATVGADTVRHLKILTPGHVDTPAHPSPVHSATETTTPTRQTTQPAPAEAPRQRHPAYLATLAVAREHKPDPIVNPDLTRVIEQQTEALLAGREPETAFSEAVYQQERARARAAQDAAQSRPSLEASLRAARRRKRAEEGGTGRRPSAGPARTGGQPESP